MDASYTTQNRGEVNGIMQLLGCKYSITDNAEDESIVGSVPYGDSCFYITEQAACPIGFAAENYLLAGEVKALPKEQRGMALLNAAVVYPEDESKVSGVLSHLDTAAINFEESADDLAGKAQALAVQDFKRDSHGFSCSTDYDTDRFVYFSVPNDDGWQAYIDGNKSEIINSAGMMLLKVPSGNHSIRFYYETPGWRAGAAVSVISLLILAAAVINCRRKNVQYEYPV